MYQYYFLMLNSICSNLVINQNRAKLHVPLFSENERKHMQLWWFFELPNADLTHVVFNAYQNVQTEISVFIWLLTKVLTEVLTSNLQNNGICIMYPLFSVRPMILTGFYFDISITSTIDLLKHRSLFYPYLCIEVQIICSWV